MRKKTVTLAALTFAVALLATASLGFAAAATPATATPMPAQAQAPPQLDAPASTPAAPAGSEKTFVSAMPPEDECDLNCLREFRACRNAAFGSGGPGFPAAAYEACADEHVACTNRCAGEC